MSFFAGSFTTNTVTGNQAITGVGFTPVAVYFFLGAQTATGTVTGAIVGIGAATSSTQHSAVSGASLDAVDPINCDSRFVTDSCFQVFNNASVLVGADFVSFDGDGFTIDITTAAAAGRLISFICFGGTGVEAYAGNYLGPTTTGTVSKTDPGFLPTAILFWGMNSSATGNMVDINIGWGATSGAGEEFNVGLFDDDGVTTSDNRRRVNTTKCVSFGVTTVAEAADLSSFDATGFTLDYTAQDGNARRWGYLALKGVEAQTKEFTQHTSNANLAVTGIGFEPECLLVTHIGSTSNDASVDDIVAGIGAATSTTARSALCISLDDAAGAAVCDRRYVTDKIVTILTPPTPTLAGEADLVTFDSDGFTLAWTSVDGTARKMFGIAFRKTAVQAIAYDVGEMVVPAAAGNLSITGVGFRPKGILLFSTLSTGLTGHGYFLFGAASGVSNQWAVGNVMTDGAGTTVCDSRLSTSVCLTANDNGTLSVEASLVSFDSDGFTLNFSTVTAFIVASKVGYVAFTGDDLSCFAGSTNGPTTATTSAVTGVGFIPTALIFAQAPNGTSTGNTVDANMMIGAAAHPGEEWCGVCFDDDNVGTSASTRRFRTDKCIGRGIGSDDELADLDSFDSDGFTLDYTTQDGTSRKTLFFALEGVTVQAGTFDTPTGVGSEDHDIDFDPEAILFLSTASVDTTAHNDLMMSFGAVDPGLEQGTVGYMGQNNADFTQINRAYANDRSLTLYTPITPSSVGLLNVTALAGPGFTGSWTGNDGTARVVGYLAFGAEWDVAPTVFPELLSHGYVDFVFSKQEIVGY